MAEPEKKPGSFARSLGRALGSLTAKTRGQFSAGLRGDPVSRTEPVARRSEERVTTDAEGRAVILRRTTIDEIEVRDPAPGSVPGKDPP